MEEEKKTEFNNSSEDSNYLRKAQDQFYEKYEELEELGNGGAAVVKKCQNRLNSKIYACKIMHNRDEEKEKSSRAEFDLIDKLEPHKNIISAIEFISTKTHLYNILEFTTGIEIQNYIKQQ